MRLLLAIAAPLAVVFLTIASPALAQRVELPIRQSDLTDGTPRYSVTVRVGNTDVDAMLDTGSTGLRIMAAGLRDGDVTPTGQANSYGYTSGVQYTGVIARASVSFGALTSPRPLALSLIQSIACRANRPQCPASRMPAADYRIGGSGLARQGFYAILGLNMAGGDAPNPLMAMGVDSWIIILPRSNEPGRLIINPTREESTGFTGYAIDPRFAQAGGSFHDGLSGCLTGPGGQPRLCGPVLLDSGAPAIQITPADGAGPPRLAPNAQVTLAFQEGEGPPISTRFTLGRGRATNLVVIPTEGQPRTRISAGSQPFMDLQVIYLPNLHAIGLKPR